jgi:hypothetical protein
MDTDEPVALATELRAPVDPSKWTSKRYERCEPDPKHARHGCFWNREEDRALRRARALQIELDRIAAKHQRSLSAVALRVGMLEGKLPDDAPESAKRLVADQPWVLEPRPEHPAIRATAQSV